jgi:hypothetical protein
VLLHGRLLEHSNHHRKVAQSGAKGGNAMSTRRVGLFAWLCITAGVLIPGAAQAQNTFRVYGGLAPTPYKISFDSKSPYPSQTAKSQYTAANVGLSWISPTGIFVDFAASQSLSATHDLWDSVPGGQSKDFSHDSYTLTGGYNHGFAQGASVSGFGGLISSRTILNAPKPPLPFSKDTFDARGIFIGVGGGIPALGGQITGSLAVAGMSGTWKDDNGFNNHADTTFGFSLGAAYTYKFSPAWGITADLKGQSYKYNFAVYSTTQPAYTVTEKIVSAGVRLSYQF